mmetsp:Transcript_39720/g.119384  ORF Transcript_39720/g.119384 Transcript_39720/m.119384 type:complete len:178 (-) Transcript_39720:158-691(-)
MTNQRMETICLSIMSATYDQERRCDCCSQAAVPTVARLPLNPLKTEAGDVGVSSPSRLSSSSSSSSSPRRPRHNSYSNTNIPRRASWEEWPSQYGFGNDDDEDQSDQARRLSRGDESSSEGTYYSEQNPSNGDCYLDLMDAALNGGRDEQLDFIAFSMLAPAVGTSSSEPTKEASWQ